MKVFKSFNNIENSLRNGVIALGTFDGVHLGHQAVINAAIKHSQENACKVIVFSFSNHPLSFINPENTPGLLIDNTEKILLLEKLNVDALINIKFDEKVIGIEPKDFIEQLVVSLNPQAIFVGDNFTYGKKGAGNTDTLKRDCMKRNIFIDVLPMFSIDGITVSSTVIRNFVKNADIESANKFLGRKYSLRGKVTYGAQLGRKIGFPTANIELKNTTLLVPPNGGYIAEVLCDGKLYPAVANIGVNPTVADSISKRLEVHIFDFNKDIYNQEIVVYLHKYVSPEKKFPNLDELIKHIENISSTVRKYFQK